MFHKVLMAIDGSVDARHACEEAVRCRLIAKDAQVELIAALGFTEPAWLRRPDGAGLTVFREEFRIKHVEPTRRAIEELGFYVSQVHLVDEAPAVAIARLAKERGADLVVLGRRGLGAIKELFLGSVSQRVLESCSVPVLVVPHGCEPPTEPFSIVAATDFSPAAAEGLAVAERVAKGLGVRLVLCHSFPPEPAIFMAGVETTEFVSQTALEDLHRRLLADHRKSLDALVQGLTKKGLMVTGIFSEHRADEAIVEAADQVGAALIVLGSHGRSGFRKLLLGSNAAKVLRAANSPVLVIPVRS